MPSVTSPQSPASSAAATAAAAPAALVLPAQPVLHYGVVGGGMLGLTLAWRLVQAGHRVSVLEAAPGVGGLARPWHIDTPTGAVEWDRYYHVIDGRDAVLRALLAELGLERQIVWRTTRTLFYDGSRLHPLNHALDYLRLPGIHLLDKARLALTLLRAARVADTRALEGVTAQAWLTQQGGARNWQSLWRPLLRAKLGANAEHASASYIVAVIRRFYGARQGRLKTERYGVLPGGYRQVLDALQQRLQDAGVALHTGWPVSSVAAQGAGGFVLQRQGPGGPSALACDRVVLTCATPLVADICALLSAPERAALRGLRYQGIVCVSLLLKRALGGAYLTYITDDSVPFTTVIEMTVLADRQRLGGHHLVYLPRYVPVDDAYFEHSDARITAEFLAALMRMVPGLQAADVVASRVARTRHVLAINTLNYSAHVPPMATSVAGLHVVSSAQIVNAALTVNDTVALANDSAAALCRAARPAGAPAMKQPCSHEVTRP